MTKKQQAKQIIDRFRNTGISFCEAKECARIAVELVITSNPHSNPFNTDGDSTMGYWLEVKNEIEKP